MKHQYSLDREFIKWFYEAEYPTAGSNRCQVVMQASNCKVEVIDTFMREAFKVGAQSMANETRCVLTDWACAVEGCDPEFVAPAEVFDRAEENLEFYYDTVFGEDDES
jgi:hypothetical protein